MSSWLGFRLDTAEVVSSNLIRPTKRVIMCVYHQGIVESKSISTIAQADSTVIIPVAE